MKKQTPKAAAAPAAGNLAPASAAMPPGCWPRDEFTGRAGRYVRDPVTGVRRPADEPVTEQPPPAA